MRDQRQALEDAAGAWKSEDFRSSQTALTRGCARSALSTTNDSKSLNAFEIVRDFFLLDNILIRVLKGHEGAHVLLA